MQRWADSSTWLDASAGKQAKRGPTGVPRLQRQRYAAYQRGGRLHSRACIGYPAHMFYMLKGLAELNKAEFLMAVVAMVRNNHGSQLHASTGIRPEALV